MINRAYLVFIFSLSFIIICCGGEEGTTTEPTQTGTIKGTITDAESSLPIPYVNVTTLPPTSSVTTDTLGVYSIEHVFPDTFAVVATKSGYHKDSVLISVLAGNITIGDIQLLKDTTKSHIF